MTTEMHEISCPLCNDPNDYSVRTFPKSPLVKWVQLFTCKSCKEMFQAIIRKFNIKQEKVTELT